MQLSMNTATRSPRLTPRAAKVAASRSEARSISLKVGRSLPATISVLPGERLALERRNSSTRMALSAALSRDLVRQLPIEEGGDRRDRIEIVGDDLGVAHLDRELAFEEGDELQD